MKSFKAVLAAGIAVMGAVAAAPAIAQKGTGIPVLFVAEDSDQNSVKRSSDIMYRVVSELQEQFDRDDWYVMDEGMIAGKKGWKVMDRRPREELSGLVDLACRDGDATSCPRAMVVIKIRAFAEPFGGATRARVRVSGDVFDQATNRFLSSWEAPTQVWGAPYGCAGVCIEEEVGGHAREIAISVGTVLKGKLASYNDAELRRSSAGSASAVKGGESRDKGLINRYLIHFKNFRGDEIDTFTGILEHEFPDFGKVDGINGPVENRRYNYASYAPIDKVEGWIRTALRQTYYRESDVHVHVDGREITIDKLR
jgi:hypothetical protein